MRRRDFIALIGSGVTARPLVARAQQIAGLRRIGVLMAAAEDSAEYQGFFAAFRAGLRDLGWIDGRNLAIETRWCGFNKDLTQQFAKELVARQPELIVSSTTPTTAALQLQTRTIPIVFVSLVDPIGSGFVDSLPRPGGNLTGFINNESTMTGKWLELLKEIAPGTARAAILFNPITAPYAEYFLKTLRANRLASGIEAIATPFHDKTELESVVADFARQPDGGLVVLPDSFIIANRAEVIALAARYHLPLISPYRFYCELGGLLCYGVDVVENYRRAASYADLILKGAKPSELPVQAPVKFELVINSKTAKALGLAVPINLTALADEVIE
jgi:putative ABC transport system substrate-binding protein